MRVAHVVRLFVELNGAVVDNGTVGFGELDHFRASQQDWAVTPSAPGLNGCNADEPGKQSSGNHAGAVDHTVHKGISFVAGL
jgi:hypothetical protein